MIFSLQQHCTYPHISRSYKHLHSENAETHLFVAEKNALFQGSKAHVALCTTPLLPPSNASTLSFQHQRRPQRIARSSNSSDSDYSRQSPPEYDNVMSEEFNHAAKLEPEHSSPPSSTHTHAYTSYSSPRNSLYESSSPDNEADFRIIHYLSEEGNYSASVSHDRKLLAICSYNPVSNSPYQTKFVPIDHNISIQRKNDTNFDVPPNSRSVGFTGPGKFHIQFIYNLPDSWYSSNSNIRKLYYIRFVAGRSIRTLEIETKFSRNKNRMIHSKHSNLHTVHGKEFLWSSWDSENCLLYTLTLRSNRTKSSSQTVSGNGSASFDSSTVEGEVERDCVLKCYDIALVMSSVVKKQKKDKQHFEYHLKMDIPCSALYELNRNSQNKPDVQSMDGWDNIQSYSHSDLKLHLLHLGKDSMCFCQQHCVVRKQKGNDWQFDVSDSPPKSASPEKAESEIGNSSSTDLSDFHIPVSVYSLNHKKRIRVQIPLPTGLVSTYGADKLLPSYSSPSHSTMSPSATTSDMQDSRKPPKVIFSTSKNFLIIFLPGVFLEILDLSPEHDPWSIARFTHSQLDGIPSLPHYSPNCGQLLSPLQDSHFNSYLFNHRHGEVYTWKFCEERIRDLYIPTISSLEDMLKILHMVQVFSFSERRDHILSTLIAALKSMDHLYMGDIITDHLLGLTYASASDIIRDSSFLSLIPMSLLEQYKPEHHFQADHHSIEDIKGTFFEIQNRFVRRQSDVDLFLPHHLARIQANDREVQRRVSELKQQLHQKAPKTSQSSFKLNLFSFFTTNSKREEQIQPAESMHNYKIHTILQNLFVENLQVVLTQHAPSHLSSRISKYCSSYSKIILEETQGCFDGLARYTNLGKRQDTRPQKEGFLFMQGLYTSLEQTGFAPPEGFIEKFVDLGYSTLPRRMFVDYINRDIFWVTKDIVDKIRDEAACGIPCEEYLHLIIRKFHQKRTEIKYYESMRHGRAQLLSFYANKLPYIPHDPNMLLEQVQKNDSTGLETLDVLRVTWNAILNPELREANNMKPQPDSATRYKIRALHTHCLQVLEETTREVLELGNENRDEFVAQDAPPAAEDSV